MREPTEAPLPHWPFYLADVLLVLAVILPAFFVSIWYLLAQRDSARQVARDKVTILVDDASDRVNASLRVHANLLTVLSEQLPLRAMKGNRCGAT